MDHVESTGSLPGLEPQVVPDNSDVEPMELGEGMAFGCVILPCAMISLWIDRGALRTQGPPSYTPALQHFRTTLWLGLTR